MPFASILCHFNRHAPIRGTAEWDGYNYVGTCRRCGMAIRRKKHRQWRKDWMK